MPRISVIIPVYKVEDYLDRCVRSVQKQTLSDLEIILVDDGSPDGCGALCDRYAAEDSRIKVIHKENGGLSSARNAGLSLATGEYIAFVDSDDHIEPTMYEVLLRALEEGEADLSLCNYAFVDETNAADGRKPPLTDAVLDRRQVLERLGGDEAEQVYYVTAWNRLYKRSLWANLRFPEGKLHEDEFTAQQIYDRCEKVATVSQVLYRYVQRSGSIMGSVSVRSLDGVEALCERAEFFLREAMMPQARRTLAAAQWKLCQLLASLPRKDAPQAYKAARSLFPLLVHRPKSAVRLALRCLRSWLRHSLEGLRHGRCLRRYKRNCAKSILLLDTPEHENIGDHAIVLAQLQLLQEVCPQKPVLEVTAGQLEGSEEEFARLTPRGKTVLIHGGGFLGCLWPQEELRFRALLKAFCGQRVVVFPQTVTFDLSTAEGRAFLRESQAAYCAHPDLTVFVREENSLALMKTHFPGVKVHLVPDTVLQLDVKLPKKTRDGVLLCLRSDLEKKLTDSDSAAIERMLENRKIQKTDTVAKRCIRPKERQKAVADKLAEFAGAKLVITDRLHGMVFAALTATPCVALGNCNGKVRGVYRWMEHLDYVYYLDDPMQLERLLPALELNREYDHDRRELAEEFACLRNLLQAQ